MKLFVLCALIIGAISSSAIAEGDLAQVAFEDGFNYLKSKGHDAVDARSASYMAVLVVAIPHCDISPERILDVALKLQMQLPEEEFNALTDEAGERISDREFGESMSADELRSFCQGVDKMFTLERY